MRHPDDDVVLDGEICGEPGCDCRDRGPEHITVVMRAYAHRISINRPALAAFFYGTPNPLHDLIARSNRPWED